MICPHTRYTLLPYMDVIYSPLPCNEWAGKEMKDAWEQSAVQELCFNLFEGSSPGPTHRKQK